MWHDVRQVARDHFRDPDAAFELVDADPNQFGAIRFSPRGSTWGISTANVQKLVDALPRIP